MDRRRAGEFSAKETHRFVELDSYAVSRTSSGLGWSTAYMSVQTVEPHSRKFEAKSDILLSLVNRGSLLGRIKTSNYTCILQSGPGSISIIPDGISFEFDLKSRISSTHLYVRRSVLNEIAVGFYKGDPAVIELILRGATFDPVLEQLCHAVRSVLGEDTPTAALYVDHIVHAISAHLIRSHSNIGRQGAFPAPSGGLDSGRLTRIRELVESRLAERLTLADLTADTGMGADHYGRLFKQKTGLTLYQFVIRCRIDRARHLLTDTKTSIAEIAHDCGFADQVHLTRVFRRIVGTTPAAYRREIRK